MQVRVLDLDSFWGVILMDVIRSLMMQPTRSTAGRKDGDCCLSPLPPMI